MMSPRSARAALLTPLLLAGLAGCSPAGPSATESPDAPPLDSAPTTSATETAIESIEETFAMPLDPYRAIVGGLSSADAEKVAAERSREDELRAQCMREQGFEYFFSPTTAEDVLEDIQRTKEFYPEGWGERGTVAFAEKYAFGLVHGPVIAQAEPGDPEDDPVGLAESDYLASLSDSERQAWETALYGDMFREPSDEPNPDEWKARGCVGWADHKVRGGKPRPQEDPAFAELVNAIYDAAPTTDNDEDMAALEAEWSTCMAAEGFSFALRQDAAITVENELDDLWPRDSDGKPDQNREPSDEEREHFFATRELPTAIADATCAEGMDYVERRHDITVAFEQRFIDDHRAQLDALVLQHGQ
ncbi:MAG TPA: hypothetical protein PKE40_05900 [Arachnia sp.]|nr:hypothetical protein [Arachnia sp.]HMT85869.1 hypothetical protein [Arachnia sp.]